MTPSAPTGLVELLSGTPAYVARPAGEARRTVVLVPDIMGLRPLFHDHADRLAAEHGWVVVAVEPWPGRTHLTVEERLEAVGSLDATAVLADLAAAADLAGVEPAAVLGFCMGGMITLQAAGSGRFDRAVAFYGMIRLPEQWRSPTQIEPLDAVTRPGAAPVLAVTGTADHWLPPDDVDALEATGATVLRYAGADHGFVHDASRPTHRPADAADAWAHVARFLQV